MGAQFLAPMLQQPASAVKSHKQSWPGAHEAKPGPQRLRLTRTVGRGRTPAGRLHAAAGGQGGGGGGAEEADEVERRLELLEELTRSRNAAVTRPRPASPQQQQQRRPGSQQAASKPERANWPEGQLLPDGWQEMDPLDKASELYLGRRGLLFWINKLAFNAVFVVLGGWILFRLVLPGIGLYSFDHEIQSLPPL